MVHDPIHLFDAHIGHPLPHALVYTDHHLVPGTVALPILSITNDLALTYNLTWFIFLIATAMGVYLLAVLWTGHRGAAVLAGLFFSFVPYRVGQGAFLQIQLLAFLPLCLACLHQYLKTGDRRWAWGLAGSFVLQSWSGIHLAAMTTLALLTALLVWAPGSGGRRVLSAAGVLATAALLAAPLAFPQLWLGHIDTLPLFIESPAHEPLVPLDYITPSGWMTRFANLYPGFEYSSSPTPFPGASVLGLAVLGALLLCLKKGDFPRPRTIGLFGVILFLVGFSLSLGWSNTIVAYLGWPERFSLLPLLSLSIFAGFGTAWLLSRLGQSNHRRWLSIGIGTVFVIESAALPADLAAFRDEPSEYHAWLKNEGGDGVILELPYFDDGSYLFSARHHGFRRTLNPSQSTRIDGTLPLEDFPDNVSLETLQGLGVRYVILHLGSFEEQRLLELLNDLSRQPGRLLPIRDFGRVVVYEVMRRKSSRTQEP